MPEDLLKKIRLYIAENPAADVSMTLEVDVAKYYEISAKVELVGAFQKDGKYKVIARMTDSEYNEDVADVAYDKIRDWVKDKILLNFKEIKPESLELVLFDLENMSDIDQCTEY